MDNPFKERRYGGGLHGLSYRCFVAKREEIIPLFGPFGLCAQIGSAECARPRRFRHNLHKWLDIVRAPPAELPSGINSDGQSMTIAKGVAVRRNADRD